MSSSSVLVIAKAAQSESVAQALRANLDFSVDTSLNLRGGLARLRRQTFILILLDETAAHDGETLDLLYQNAGGAAVLEANLSTMPVPRLLRQVRSALARRARDHAEARILVTASLQNELNASLTGLLLESELALREAPPAQAPKLRHLVQLAGDLRNRLRVHA